MQQKSLGINVYQVKVVTLTWRLYEKDLSVRDKMSFQANIRHGDQFS